MEKLKNIWRSWRTPHGAVWLPVWPPFGAFAELAALIGGIFAIDLLLPGVDVASLEPSPYWIPVLLLSLQYGTVAGLVAAGASTLVYALGGLPEQAIEENHFTYLLRVWALPILWIGVALVLGQFRLRQIEIKQRLKSELTSARKESDGLARYATSLEDRCRALERHIATSHSDKSRQLLDALAAFDDSAATPSDALNAAVRAAFPDAAITAYLVTPWGLEPSIAAGVQNAQRHDAKLKVDHALYRAVVDGRRTVSVMQQDDEGILAGEGHAAAPIVQSETGRVLGMLKLVALDASILDQNTGRHLALLGRFIAPMLSEPRVVVDNTERREPEASPGRLMRGWRQFSWQLLSHGDPGTGKDIAAGSSERGAPPGRPRVTN